MIFILYLIHTNNNKPYKMIYYCIQNLDQHECKILEYMWKNEYSHFQNSLSELYEDLTDVEFEIFVNILTEHILGSLVALLIKGNIDHKDIVKNIYNDICFNADAEQEEEEEEEIDTSKLIFPKDITDAKICEECGEYDESCGWASNEKETYFTYCCRFCDVDGSKYNDWAETEKNNLYTFDKKA